MRTYPAESSAVAAAVALLIGHLAGIRDADTITALAVVVGCVPGAVTWLVNLGRRRRGVTVQVTTARRPPAPPA